MSGSTVDEGLQPERTELAWRRTALSVAAASLATARLLPELYGNALWMFPGLAATLLAGFLWLAARRRHLRPVSGTPSGAPVSGTLGSGGAGLLALAGSFVVVLGIGGFVIVVIARLW